MKTIHNYEKTVEEVQARWKALAWVALLLVLLCCSCASLRIGEHRDIECRVLGLDASIPVPFATNVNVVNVRLGWIETKYIHGYKTSYKSDAEDELKYIGKAHRVVEIKSTDK